MAAQRENDRQLDLREGMHVFGADDREIGTIDEVFDDIGDIESFGAKGIPPQQAGHDPVQYDYSEAMPGSGESYFTIRQSGGRVLYVPLSAVGHVDGDRVLVAIDSDDVEAMGWNVRPDALSGLPDEYETDEGGEPHVA